MLERELRMSASRRAREREEAESLTAKGESPAVGEWRRDLLKTVKKIARDVEIIARNTGASSSG